MRRETSIPRAEAANLASSAASISWAQSIPSSPRTATPTLETSGLPLILFQYPDATKATYDLDTQLEIAGQEGVFATKNGVRNMRRWDTEIPVLRAAFPDLQILTCHDEYLLHTMFDVDGALVGYGGLAPEPLVELIAAGKAKDYAKAREVHDRLLPVTKNVYHRGSHMEGTVALKEGLVARGILEHATVRTPLLPLAPGAHEEIALALASAGLGRVAAPVRAEASAMPADPDRPVPPGSIPDENAPIASAFNPGRIWPCSSTTS
jgi:hypothetical protein